MSSANSPETGKYSGNKGVTLIELVIGMAILSLVGLMIGSLLTSSISMYSVTSAEADMQKESQMVGRHISSLVMEASNLYFEESEAGLFLFTGEVPQSAEDGTYKYKGDIIWFNKKLYTLYHGTDLTISVTKGEEDGGDESKSTSSVPPLTFTAVEEALMPEEDLSEYVISYRVKNMYLNITPDVVLMDPVGAKEDHLYKTKEKVVIRYTVMFSLSNDDSYNIESSTAPRNRIGTLRWKYDGRN